MNIRVLICDDHRMVREGLFSVLDAEPDITVIGQAGTGHEAVELVDQLGPHVVLMDVALPELNGMEATRRILKNHPEVKIVGLSAHVEGTFRNGMLKAGAIAFILKRSAVEEVVRAVHLAAQGKTYLSPEVAGDVVEDYIRSPEPPRESSGAMNGLTTREREMLQLIAEGLSAKEMAFNLKVSVKTIETHRRNLMQKLNLHSVAELTKYAIREGFTSLDF